MRQENPEEVEQMKLENMVVETQEEDDAEAMEADLEADQSLEAKIEREVRRTVKTQVVLLQ